MPVVFGEEIPKVQQSSTPVLPNIERRTRPKFSMLIHPQQWAWDPEEKVWLPRISKYKHDPGVQGVAYDSVNKMVDTSEADNFYRKKGYLIFDNGDARLQQCADLNGGEFMSRFRAGKGYAYAWIWEGFERLGNQVIWEENKDKKRALQQWLISSGLVQEMNPRLKQIEINKIKARVRRLAEHATTNQSPSLRLRLTAAENLLVDMEAEAKGEDKPSSKRGAK